MVALSNDLLLLIWLVLLGFVSLLVVSYLLATILERFADWLDDWWERKE